MASTWSQGDWNLGSWNDAAVGAVLTGQSVTTSVGDVVANAELRSGWSRGTYSSASWNQAADVFFAVNTAGELSTSINLGFGWSRESWNEGNWNSSLGFVLTGNGNVFSITTLSQLDITANTIVATGSTSNLITGEELVTSQGEESVIAYANAIVTGEELTTTVNTFAVAASGAITINTPTFEANVELNNDGVTVGLASFLNITGFPLFANLGTVTTTSENIIPITGEQANITVNNISLSTEQILTITGNSVTISSASIVPNSQNFISLSGLRANANVATLKFWDPISGNITETWTNIH
jgi:hypothetical protein